MIRYKTDPNDPGKPLRKTIDIAPSWWSGGIDGFVDGAEILMLMARDCGSDPAPRRDLLMSTVATTIGVKGVELVIGVREDMTDEAIEIARVDLVRALDKLADGHERRTEIMRVHGEIVAERAGRKAQRDAAQAC
jgi:hypothetical protein